MSFFQGRLDREVSPPLDVWLVDPSLGMTQGYGLDFSDRTFNAFVKDRFGVDVMASPTLSKARRLRGFLRALVPRGRLRSFVGFSIIRRHRRDRSNRRGVDGSLDGAHAV